MVDRVTVYCGSTGARGHRTTADGVWRDGTPISLQRPGHGCLDIECDNTYPRWVVSSARQALRQRRPFRSVEQEAFLALVRTATALTDALEQVLRTEGLTLAQYNVLRILRGAEPAGLCRNEVRDRMLTRMPDMTRLLDRMEAIGLVVRARTAEDRRLVTTRVTERGLQILERLDDAVTAEHRRRFAHLNKEQIRSLTGLLERVRDAAV